MSDETPDLPVAVHTGELNLCGYRLTVHTLSDGRRIYEDTPELQRLLRDLSADDIFPALAEPAT